MYYQKPTGKKGFWGRVGESVESTKLYIRFFFFIDWSWETVNEKSSQTPQCGESINR